MEEAEVPGSFSFGRPHVNDRQPHLYTRRDGRLPVVAANDTSETRRGR